MAKAEKPKAKPKPKFTDKAQSERFIETARKLGVDETTEAFENIVTKIATARLEQKDVIETRAPIKRKRLRHA